MCVCDNNYTGTQCETSQWIIAATVHHINDKYTLELSVKQ